MIAPFHSRIILNLFSPAYYHEIVIKSLDDVCLIVVYFPGEWSVVRIAFFKSNQIIGERCQHITKGIDKSNPLIV